MDNRLLEFIAAVFAKLFSYRLTNGTGPNYSTASDKALKDRIRQIDQSGFFDVIWYAQKNSISATDVKSVIGHYLENGDALGLHPHPLFDLKWFNKKYPADGSDQTALERFIELGPSASFSPLFDPAWYIKHAGDIGNVHPMLHFLRDGAARGISPHPLFNSQEYFKQSPSLAHANINPLTHFIEHGARDGLNPNAYFDASWYLACHPNVQMNPLIHFMFVGAEQGSQPHPALDLARFAGENGLKPLDAFYKIVTDQDESAIDRKQISGGISVNQQASTDEEPELREIFPYRTDPVTSQIADIGFLAAVDSDVPFEIAQEGIDAASFDVWDTLIRRDCHPDEIKVRSARYLLLKGHSVIRPAFRNIASLFNARINAENSSAPNGEFEYRFEMAVDKWLDMVLVRGCAPKIRSALREGLLKHELDAELSCTRPDIPMRNAIQNLAIPTVFASDFYMPADFIKIILRKHGFGEKFLSGYASSDRYETKRSGKMFERIIRELDVEPKSLLHLGDNAHADIAVPRELGIATVHYLSESEEARKAYFGAGFDAWRDGDLSLHHKRITELCERLANDEETNGRLLQGIGARLAPLVVGYILHVLEQAKFDQVEDLFFFTREGLFLQNVYDAVCAENPYDCETPRSNLLEVSRRATFAASLDGVTIPQLMNIWTQYSSQSMRSLAVSLNLDEKEMETCCKRFGIDIDAVITYPWQDERVKALLSSDVFLSHARARCAEQRRLLNDYLAAKGFFESDLRHIVDVGWRGTIHDNIAKLNPNVFVRGHYLGLFRYLNPQPKNVDKIGWLFNDNRKRPMPLKEVAPLELLTNGPGGSVQTYRRTDDGVIAEKLIIDGEEDVIVNEIATIQSGILAAVKPLVEYVRLHGLTSEDILPLARAATLSLINTPPSPFADAFNRLEHNETFGTGGTQQVGGESRLSEEFAKRTSSDLHAYASQRIKASRWPEAQVFASDMIAWYESAPVHQRKALPDEFTRLAAPALQKVVGSRLSVYAPSPLVASGGHRTIFNTVRRLVKLGFNAEIFLEGIGSGIDCVEGYLAGTPAIIHTEWHQHIPAKVAFATVAHSSQFIREVNADYKCYLVQDFESLFNPMSDGYVVCENSYAEGHQHFTIGNWLTHMINSVYGAAACPAGLGVDTSLYRVSSEIKPEQAVCFLYQPDKPRRTPNLGITALRQLRQQMPGVKIYVYGSNLPLNLDFEVENLGLINDLSALNALYNKCMVGLCISGSNPSRIPYEMMAAGCVPVDLYRYNNLMDHQTGTVALAYQDSSSLCAAMAQILSSPSEYDSRRAASIKFASSRSLDWEVDVIANGLLAHVEGKLPPMADVKIMYKDAPIIAETSYNMAVERYCATQRNLAEKAYNLA